MTTENKAKHFAHFILAAKNVLFSRKTTANERAHDIFAQRLNEMKDLEQKGTPPMDDMF